MITYRYLLAFCLPVLQAMPVLADSGTQPASDHTKVANQALYQQLDFSDKRDFEDAGRGLIAATPDVKIRDAAGNVIWDMSVYRDFLKGKAPDSVNPSLWRQALLNSKSGLYKVVDGIYQVRGYDLTTMSVIRGETGWIVIDPLTTAEVSSAAMELVNRELGERPVSAVIYTHTHADHFGGVKGVISQADVDAGKVRVIAPEHFMEHVASEFALAGNVMTRRTQYMHAMLLPPGPRGQVDNGLGKALAGGALTLIEPTDYATHTGQKMVVDGLEIEFLLAPGTEADAEMMFYFPRYRALMGAENLNAAMHNLLTPRGAKIRDPLTWSKALTETLELFGNRTDVVFTAHYWPRWGRENVHNYIAKQRDMLKYLHDQTLRLANQGYKMGEIAENFEIPESLDTEWFNRGYYGSVTHNVKAVYQRYLGFWSNNPADLHELPPAVAGARYVQALGGADAVIEIAGKAFASGDYRWAAMLLNHLVMSQPNHQAARDLQADIFEQLGYQAESGPWRNIYLTGAMELRNGIVEKPGTVKATTPDLVAALSTEQVFDLFAVRLNGPRAAGQTLRINWVFLDIDQQYAMKLEHSVLTHVRGKTDPQAGLTLTLSRDQFNRVLLQEASFGDLIAEGVVTAEGELDQLATLFGLMDSLDVWFNVVTPVSDA